MHHHDTTPLEIKKIGFVGLGNMGFPMALRLIKAGYAVTVYDVRPEPGKLLQEEGAKIALSVSELAQDQDVIITMLQSGELVRKICLGEKGIYLNVQPRTIHIDTSSIDVETTRELHESAEMAGVLSLDAPVSGYACFTSHGKTYCSCRRCRKWSSR
jgi:3-hydroxyisobutyrate dehydrogenase